MSSIQFTMLPPPEVLKQDVECVRIARYSGTEAVAIRVAPGALPGLVFQHCAGRPVLSGKCVRAKANQYARLRKRLQQKGTRSATRRLVAISGRERRLKADANHVVSKRIVEQHPHSLIGLGNLTDLRERTPRRKGKRASKMQRKANAAFSRRSFAELQSMIASKAVMHESMAVKVDAHYTSQACPICGHTARENRPDKGLMFVCHNCHYALHADLVGARNITMRTLLIRQDWMSTGVLSVRPDASDGEAKAARLQRYAELRWCPDASPRHSDVG